MEDYRRISRLSSCSYGRIKSLKFGKEKILNYNNNDDKYFRVNLSKNGKYKTKLIHVLMFEVFNNYKLKKNECIHHIDFTKNNNNLDNFQLMIKNEHRKLHMIGKNNINFGKSGINLGMKFSIEHKNKISESNKGKKLSEETKRKMSESHRLSNKVYNDIEIDIEKGNLTQREISKKYEVCQGTISNIKRRKNE